MLFAYNLLMEGDFMNDKSMIGTNIRVLRKIFDETQEELALVLNVGKTTISQYETGKREPYIDTLEKIADHYMITVDVLTSYDLSDQQYKIEINEDVLLNRMVEMTPYFSSDKSKKNEYFCQAFKLHKRIMNKIPYIGLGWYSLINKCLQEYMEAYKDNEIKDIVAANILSICTIALYFSRSLIYFIDNAAVMYTKYIEGVDQLKYDLEDIPRETKSVIDKLQVISSNPEYTELIDKMYMDIKSSNRFIDLAYYYIALHYVLNIVDNDYDWKNNQHIGMEMMESFGTINNKYAIRFLEYMSELLGMDTNSWFE